MNIKNKKRKEIISNSIVKTCRKVCKNISTDPDASITEEWDWKRWLEPIALKVSKDCDYSEITLTLDILRRAVELNLNIEEEPQIGVLTQ
jgi:hypothetical protein